MDQDLDHKMVDKELVHRHAMHFLVHSFEVVAYYPSEAVAYLEAVVYFPCEVDQSVEAVDHNYRMMEILPRG